MKKPSIVEGQPFEFVITNGREEKVIARSFNYLAHCLSTGWEVCVNYGLN